MNVKVNDYILFKIDNDLFEKTVDFTLSFDKLCILEGKQLGGKPTLKVISNAVLDYHKPFSKNEGYLILGELIKGKVRQRKIYKATSGFNKQLVYFQGKVNFIVPVVQEGISISQASLVDLGNRYVQISSELGTIVNGDVYYKGIKQEDEWVEISASDTLNAELTLKADSGYTVLRPNLKLKLNPSLFGFTIHGVFVNVPYTYKKGKLIIPACCIFEDIYDEETEETETPIKLVAELREGIDTKYYCYIDNRQVLIKDGFTIKDELNETLDSGTFEFASIGGELPIEPFDSIYFESEVIPNFEPKRQLLDTYFGEIYNLNDTLANSDYYYQVNIFSETKQLERITLPNLAITKRPNNYTMQTVFEKVKEYCRRYLPYIRIYNSADDWTFVPCFKYDPELEERLNMECPEFVWNTPTLREVLNDLFSVADLLPIIKNNILTFIDLRAKGNPIDETKLTNRQVSGTSADYCDNMTVPMKNIISKKPVIKQEHIGFRSTEGEVNTNNGALILQKPIYNIRKVIMYRKFDDDFTRLVRIDITDLVVEKKEFDTLNLPTSAQWFTKDRQTLRGIKPTHAYYTRGSNQIEGILRSTHSLVADYCTIGLMGLYTTDDDILELSAKDIYDGFMHDTLDTFFEIGYETIEETTINVSKEKPIKNMQNSLFDSQSANSVDLDHQTIFEYAKINRLANKIETIYGEYFDEADIPQLADYLGDKILFSREITYYDNIIYFKGQIVDNYILRDYFTGVQSKRRSWNIADTDEAINRDDVYKLFIAFDTVNIGDTSTSGYYLNFYSFDYFNFIDVYQESTEKNKFSNAIVWTRSNYTGVQMDFPNDDDYGVLETHLTETAYSINIYTRFIDNKRFGDEVTKDGSLLLQSPVKYVDGNGEFQLFYAKLNDKLDEGDENYYFDDRLEDVITSWDAGKFDWLINQCNKRPRITGNNVTLTQMDVEIYFEKDNREIIGSNFNFEYVSNNDKIIVGKNFCKCVPAGSHEIASSDIGVKIATNHNYKYGDIEAVGTDSGYQADIDGDNGQITLNEFTENPNNSWCIYQKSTNEILLAVNGVQTIYANNLYVRDTNIYNDQIHKEKIGKVGYQTSEELEESYDNSPIYISEFNVLGRTITAENTKDFNSNN